MRFRRLLLSAALVGGACSHEQPFESPDNSTDRPFLPGTPARLTYNPGSDEHPSWTGDAASILYSAQQFGRPDLDRCIAQLPATGGSAIRTICNPNPAAADSADRFDAPSAFDDERLLFIRATGRPGAIPPDQSGIYLGTLSDPLTATRLLSLPYSIPGGQTHAFISTARWLSTNRVMYVGQSVIYSREFDKAPLDTLITGLEVVEMDLSGAQPTLAVVPGTYGASSAALVATRDTLYYTLNGDSRVFRLAFATGQTTIAHDFGSLGIARDVTVLGARLVAVVGGEVYYEDNPTIGPIQPDGGGTVYSVDLTTGDETALPGDPSMVWRRPEFAPTTNPVRLVVEGYPRVSGNAPTRNELVSKVGDLYLYVAP